MCGRRPSIGPLGSAGHSGAGASLWPDLWSCPLPSRSSAGLPTPVEPCPRAAAHMTISFASVADGHPCRPLNPAGWRWFEAPFAGSCPEPDEELAVATGGRTNHRHHRRCPVKSGGHDQATGHSGASQRGRRCRLGPGGRMVR